MTTIPSGGARLWCDEHGAGEPVVLVHAGIADSRMWDGVVPLLARSHRVVRFDMRGYGRSALPPGEFSHVDDLAAVLTATEAAPAHLVGSSLGGRVALDLAVERPELARSLVLLGAPVSGFAPEVDPPPLWDELVAAHRADDVEAMADVEARMWLADPDGSRLPPGVLDLVREMNRHALASERSGVAQERDAPIPATDRLDELTVPVLVVVGDLDQPDIRLAADLVTDQVAGAERVDLPGVAHLPALERPAELAELITDFLDRHTAGRGGVRVRQAAIPPDGP